MMKQQEWIGRVQGFKQFYNYGSQQSFWEFQLVQQNSQTGAFRTLNVSLKGVTISGHLANGHLVRINGYCESSNLIPSQITNETNQSTILVHQTPKWFGTFIKTTAGFVILSSILGAAVGFGVLILKLV